MSRIAHIGFSWGAVRQPIVLSLATHGVDRIDPSRAPSGDVSGQQRDADQDGTVKLTKTGSLDPRDIGVRRIYERCILCPGFETLR